MKRSIILIYFAIFCSPSYAGNWSERDEMYAACGQDPSEWCLKLLVKTCGKTVTDQSIICARRNANRIMNASIVHNRCTNKVCDNVRSGGGGTPEAIECYRKADIICK